MRLVSLVAVASILISTAVACSSETEAPTDNTETANGSDEELKAAVIGEKENGKSVDVAAGRSFTIALDSSPWTGFHWIVKTVDKSLGQPTQSTVPGDTTRPGAPGVQKFTWKTKSALVGSHAITLAYQKGSQAPAKTFKVTINVVDNSSAKACGGLAGLTCPAGSYCEFEANQACGFADQQGKCVTKPDVCPDPFIPVCGCDGKDYDNACFANAAGTSVAHAGQCAQAGTPCGNGTCGAGMVCCNPLQAICTLPGKFCIQ
jgi:predicted secreted protein